MNQLAPLYDLILEHTNGGRLLATLCPTAAARVTVVTLTRAEAALLEALHAGQAKLVTRAALLEAASLRGDSNTLEVLISRIRQKLGKADAPVVLQTIRGRGYLLAVAS